MSNDNQIKLVIVTTSGTVTHAFNIHDRFQQVQHQVFHELHIVPSPNDQWELKYGDTILALTQVIKAAGLPDGARLTLAPKEGGGG